MVFAASIFDPIFNGLAFILSGSYDLIHNYAFAITALTTAVMLVTAPLTVKSMRSTLAMQRLAPEMKRLQQEHKHDRTALNEAMMALYKEHNANPFGGCLPMLLPMPIFIVMYRVIAGISHKKGQLPSPKYITHGRMYHDIVAGKGKLSAFGIDLAKSASQATKESLVHGLPFLLLVALVIVTGYYQSKQMMARNPQAAAQANPQQQMMTRMFPLLFGFISFTVPAGVALYFLVSNLFRVAQQDLMYRYDPELSKEVKAEVKEVEAKASEIERRPKKKRGTPPPSSPKGLGRGDDGAKRPGKNGNGSGRVTPKSSGKKGAKRGRRGR
jgi:YidC/Oxa1 family membrane protein insertase